MQKLLNVEVRLNMPLNAQQSLHLRRKLVIEFQLEKHQ